MVRVWFRGKPVVIVSSRESAQEYIGRHRPEVQKWCEVTVTHETARKEGSPCESR